MIMEEVDEKIRFKITQSKMYYLGVLESNLIKLEKYSGEVLKRIKDQGLASRYSANSDVMRHAEGAWRASLALNELEEIIINLENKIYKYPDPPEEATLLTPAQEE